MGLLPTDSWTGAAPAVSVRDDTHFRSIDPRRDHAPSTRGSGDSRFPRGLWPSLASVGRGIHCPLQPEPDRSERGQSDHGASNRLADGPSDGGAGNSLVGVGFGLACPAAPRPPSFPGQNLRRMVRVGPGPDSPGRSHDMDRQIGRYRNRARRVGRAVADDRHNACRPGRALSGSGGKSRAVRPACPKQGSQARSPPYFEVKGEPPFALAHAW